MFREAAPQIGLSPAETTFVVQGFGNVGSWAARIMQQLGSKMVGASDATGAIHSEAGIDADDLANHIKEGGKLTEFPGAEVISPDDLLAIECDVLIPAALGGMIHEGNADRINCKMIIEGANSPTTPAADEILHGQGRLRDPRRDGERRRRRRLLLRVGPEPPALPLVRARGQRQARRHHAQGLPRRLRPGQGGEDPRCATRAYLVGIERVVEASRTRGYI